MKVFAFVLAVLAVLCPNLSLQANDDLVKIHYQGDDLLAKQLIKGHLDLYVSNQHEKKRVFGPRYRKQRTAFVKRYYLKCGKKMGKISPYNFKKVVNNFLTNAPELLQRLGRPGFRYENISSIIRFYNTFRIPEVEPSLDVESSISGRS